MHGSASAPARTPRAWNMSPRSRRTALVDLISAGIFRAVTSDGTPSDGRESPDRESSIDALALSPESRLSVATRAEPARNQSKAGERV